jgi:teichuronic acid biosynthesis glycosyltransferase TuaC
LFTVLLNIWKRIIFDKPNEEMKILFVYRGYSPDLSNSVVDFQRHALEKMGLKVDCYPIRKGGFKGYFQSWKELREMISKCDHDLIHAHYSFSGYVAALATRKPVVCSFMGSDVLQQKRGGEWVTAFFSRFFWKVVIVKSKHMQQKVKNAIGIPNGVDFDNFREISRTEALQNTGFDPDFKHVIFVAQQPESYVKNLSLAQKAVFRIKDKPICLHTVSGVGFEMLPYYYSAADLLVLTSLTEGSPNVIKEAMACNCPIVATDVGDIREVVKGTQGCFLTGFDPADVAEKIRLALAFKGRTNGREKIGHLDNRRIAKKIINVYKKVLQQMSGHGKKLTQ